MSATHSLAVADTDQSYGIGVDENRRLRLIPPDITNEAVNSSPAVADHSSENSNSYMVAVTCRICHLMFEHGDGDDVDEDCGEAMKLGCNCKGDLGTAHQKCAATWFLTRRSVICEICGAIVQNVVDMVITEETEETTDGHAEVQTPRMSSLADPIPERESENSGILRNFVNVLLGCMVVAFFISWFFHFKRV